MNARHEIAATLLLLCGLCMLLAFAAAPLEMARDQPEPAATNRDSEILASCMNGQRISVDEGYVMTCRVRRVRM